MDANFDHADENSRHGGWKTLLFLLPSSAAMVLSGGAWMNNIIVFLINEFNLTSINAAQIYNLVSGCISFLPIIVAIIADSWLGCFTTIWILYLISLMGPILLLLIVTVDGLKPPYCADNSGTGACPGPSPFQNAVLYTALALAIIGTGGAKFAIAAMGANQFENQKDRATYFNWYLFVLYVAAAIGITGMVYIEDNVSWPCGFGLSVATGVLGLVILLLGSRYYRQDKPQGSPFTSLVRVVVASIRKRKVRISSQAADYYFGNGNEIEHKGTAEAPSSIFRFFNRAALITNEDVMLNDTVEKSWKLCTVQQVEDLKTLIRLAPLWSTSIFLNAPFAILSSFTVLQALTMDRHVTSDFQIPSGSIGVFLLLSTCVTLALLERLVWPMWKKFTGLNVPTQLQQIGTGHVFNVLTVVISALVESKRRGSFTSNHLQGSEIVPMSVLWLVPQMGLLGVAEAFHFPAQFAFFYLEFPSSLKTVATALVSSQVGVAFYVSTALVDFVREKTGWLPNNINYGKLENVYWVLAVIVILNYGYYLVCACLFKCKEVEQVLEDK